MKAALLCVCAIAGTAAAEAPTSGLVERSRLEVQPVTGKAIKQISIDNPLGDVKVEGYDGTSILIETRKQAPDEEGLDRLRVSLVPNPDGTVRITTTADGGKEFKSVARSAMRVDLIVRAPREARVEAMVSAGTLEVNNMDAGGELDSASGSISVQNVQGALSTHTVTGPTSLTQVFGSVDAQTLSSHLAFDSIRGERLVASANKGSIAGRRVRSRDVELTTTDGKITLEAESSLRSRLVVASLRGDIDVKLRRNGVLIVRARGTKVNLGSAMAHAKSQADGWVQTQIGILQAKQAPALVELRSRYGIVQFAVIE